MTDPGEAMRASSRVRISVLVALLLGIRFASSAAMAGANLSPETVASLSGALDLYDALLPIPLILVVLFVCRSTGRPWTDPAALGMAGLLTAGWALGLAGPGSVPPSALPILATIAVALGSALSLRLYGGRGRASRGWAGWAYLAFLLEVPLVLALRIAAYLGLGTSVGSGGTVQGNWILVYAPTILLAFLAIAVWANVALDAGAAQIRERWTAFLPFVAVPLYAIGAAVQPLAGYILSAFITWGSNLALFTPPWLSLTLSVAAVACFVSSFLLVDPEAGREGRALLFVGTATVILAGFYASATSVAGLVAGLLIATVGFAIRRT